jgi:hypothetical protein
MEFDITIWVVEQIAFKLAARRYDIDQSEGHMSAKIDQEDSLENLYTSWPNLAEQVRNYLDGYYQEYKRGRDFGQLSADQKQIIADNL